MSEAIEQARDIIYEAALVPTRWEDALGAVSKIADGMGAVLFAANSTQTRWRASTALKPIMEDFLQSWAHRNTRAQRMLAAQSPGFVGELEVFTADELRQEPIYKEFLRPRGMGWGAATTVVAPTGDQLVFAVERTFARGPFERSDLDRLDRLRPDLCRATMIAARIGLERARATAETLEAIGLAAVIVSSRQRVLFANKLFDQMGPAARIGASNALLLGDAQAQALIATALANFERPDPKRTPLSIPLRSAEDAPLYVAHLVPIRGFARDLFLGARCCIIFTRVGALVAPSVPLLIGLFDMTAAEARIAARLAAGDTPTQISEQLDVSLHTVKSHMKAIFQKAGVQRQAALVKLIDSLQPLPF